MTRHQGNMPDKNLLWRAACGMVHPSAVIVWLPTTFQASSFGSGGDLFVRRVQMAHLPDLDGYDTMELYAAQEDGDSGPMWGFKRRYWDLDGTTNLEMQEMHIDPQGPLRQHFETRTIGSASSRRDRTWWTDQDGDPRPRLLASGWTQY